MNSRVTRALLTAIACGSLIGAGTGCRTLTDRNPFARNLNPPRLDDSKPVSADEVLERIDANARKIASLITDLDIQADIENSQHGVKGRMWMQRDRDFRLMVEENIIGKIADLGSNAEGFWFWTKALGPRQPKQFFVCSYDETGSTPLEMAFQPDWIVEAIGLKSLTREERENTEIIEGKGADEGTFLLRQRRTNANGDVFYKETIVNQNTGLIRSHKLLAPDGVTPIALADIEDYEWIPLNTDANPDFDNTSAETVALPKNFRLVWIKEQIRLTIRTVRPRINVEINPAQFIEPAFPNYERIDLRQLADNARRTSANSNEGSLPVAPRNRQQPVKRNGVIAASNEVNPEENRRNGFARPIKKAKSLMDGLVGAPYPRGPQTLSPPSRGLFGID